jgi:hypothetical protein
MEFAAVCTYHHSPHHICEETHTNIRMVNVVASWLRSFDNGRRRHRGQNMFRVRSIHNRPDSRHFFLRPVVAPAFSKAFANPTFNCSHRRRRSRHWPDQGIGRLDEVGRIRSVGGINSFV